MRERPNRAVSKTAVAQVTVGSNPTPSAKSDLGKQDEPRPTAGARSRNSRAKRARIFLSTRLESAIG